MSLNSSIEVGLSRVSTAHTQRGMTEKGTVDNKRSSAPQAPNQVAPSVAWKQVLRVQCVSVNGIHVVPGAKDSSTNVLARTTKSLARGDFHVPYQNILPATVGCNASGTAPGVEMEILSFTRRIVTAVGPGAPPGPALALRNPSGSSRT